MSLITNNNEVKDVSNYRKIIDIPISYGNGIKPWMKISTFDWVYNTIKSDVKKYAIEEIRKETDKDKKSVLKQEKLGYFNIGLFKDNYRSNENFISTEFMLFDFDHLEGDINDYKNKLKENPKVYAAFISPSGDGLKVIFRLDKPITDPTIFSFWYKHYAVEFEAALGKAADKTSDVSRPCFFSWDPDMYVNENAIPLSTEGKLKVPVSINRKINREELLEAYQGSGEGTRHTSLLKLVSSLIDRYLDLDFILELAHGWNLKNNPPLTLTEVTSTATSLYEKYINIDILENFWSQGKEIYQMGFVTDKFYIEPIGKDKFTAIIKDRILKKEKDLAPDELKALVQGFFETLINTKHINHLARVDYLCAADVRLPDYQVRLEEGVIEVKYSIIPENIRDNDFVEKYLGDTFGDHLDFIKRYLAVYCFSNYKKLPTLIFYGPRGSGKNTFTDIVSGICPPLSTQWSGHEQSFSYEGEKKLLIVDENDSDKSSQYKTLKKYTGQKFALVHKKFKDPYQVKNNMNIMILTNERIPLYVKKEELPTDEANNQFFVYEFKKLTQTMDNTFQQQILDRLGNYIRTVLKLVYESLQTEQYRYSIPVPITEEEKDLFNSNATELDMDADSIIQKLSKRMASCDFIFRPFIEKKLLPQSFISEWNNTITRSGKQSIIKNLIKRRLIKPGDPKKLQLFGKREYCHDMTDEFFDLVNSEFRDLSV